MSPAVSQPLPQGHPARLGQPRIPGEQIGGEQAVQMGQVPVPRFPFFKLPVPFQQLPPAAHLKGGQSPEPLVYLIQQPVLNVQHLAGAAEIPEHLPDNGQIHGRGHGPSNGRPHPAR